MKGQIAQYKLYLIGFLLGAVAGFLYWKYIGCLSGTCAITSNPLRSSVYFGIMGALLTGLFQQQKISKAGKQDKPD
jgi:hypothetical protein